MGDKHESCGCGCGEGSDSKEIGIMGAVPPPAGTTSASGCGPTGCGTTDIWGIGANAEYKMVDPSTLDYVIRMSDGVPIVSHELTSKDNFGTLGARIGIIRDDYTVQPGLYGIGNPGKDSKVLVTANYKLTFDTLRSNLEDVDAWVIVVNTFGINVWCAAGKGSFNADEVSRRIIDADLANRVNHREVILPQLAGPGVEARKIKKLAGFSVKWGPVRAEDVKGYIEAGNRAVGNMREVTFTAYERTILVPVEIYILLSLLPFAALFALIVSSIMPEFTFAGALLRGLTAFGVILAGIVAGAVVSPVLLPWLPHRAFSVKGAVAGVVVGGIAAWLFEGNALAGAGVIFTVTSISSFLAMNFTGASPYTSPTGVETEMKWAIPYQFSGLVLGVLMWIASAFVL